MKGAINGAQNAANRSAVDIGRYTYAKIVLLIRGFQLDVSDCLGIGSDRNRVFMVRNKGISGNSNLFQCVEESVNRSVALAPVSYTHLEELNGTMGIGCISDSDPQPLLVQSHLGSFAITTVGKVNNQAELIRSVYENGCTHFLEMSGSRVNTSEPVSYTHLGDWQGRHD